MEFFFVMLTFIVLRTPSKLESSRNSPKFHLLTSRSKQLKLSNNITCSDSFEVLHVNKDELYACIRVNNMLTHFSQLIRVRLIGYLPRYAVNKI